MPKTSGELYNQINDLQKEAKILEEAEIMERGCRRCREPVEVGSLRRTIAMVQPCSVGSMHETYVVCFKCFGKIFDMLKPITE